MSHIYIGVFFQVLLTVAAVGCIVSGYEAWKESKRSSR